MGNGKLAIWSIGLACMTLRSTPTLAPVCIIMQQDMHGGGAYHKAVQVSPCSSHVVWSPEHTLAHRLVASQTRTCVGILSALSVPTPNVPSYYVKHTVNNVKRYSFTCQNLYSTGRESRALLRHARPMRAIPAPEYVYTARPLTAASIPSAPARQRAWPPPLPAAP